MRRITVSIILDSRKMWWGQELLAGDGTITYAPASFARHVRKRPSCEEMERSQSTLTN